MRILITGGAGFIGRATARALLTAGCEVTLVDSLQKRVHPHGIPSDLPVPHDKLEVRDARDSSMWRELLPMHDAVLHLAAYQDYQPDYSTFFTSNVVSTSLLFETANEINWHGRVVVASSQSVIGEGVYVCCTCNTKFLGSPRLDENLSRGIWEVQCPLCESFLVRSVSTPETVRDPIMPYGSSKECEERVALHLGRFLDIPTVALRYSIVQGAGQSPWNAYSGVMRATCMQIIARRDPVIVFEDGENIRDFVSITDVVRANVRALGASEPRWTMPPGEYNVGGGSAVTVMDLAFEMSEIISSILKFDPPRVSAPGVYRTGTVRHNVSDVSKISEWWQPSELSELLNTWADYAEWFTSLKLPAEEIVSQTFDTMRRQGVLRQAQVS